MVLVLVDIELRFLLLALCAILLLLFLNLVLRSAEVLVLPDLPDLVELLLDTGLGGLTGLVFEFLEFSRNIRVISNPISIRSLF